MELSLCLEGNDFGRWVHDCAVGCDGSARDGALLMEVDDHNVIGFVYFFTNAINREREHEPDCLEGV